MLIKIMILTLAIEVFTIAGRIVNGSAKEKYEKNNSKYKLRIHHGYMGIVLVLINFLYPVEVIFVTGISLLISDAIHHFFVLPVWVRKTEFP